MKITLIVHTLILAVACMFTALGIASARSPSPSSGKKPNTLVIWGDDIGYWKWLTTFKEFPIRQKPAGFNLDAVMQQLSAAQGSE